MTDVLKRGGPSLTRNQDISRESIPLYLIDGVATVWDAQTAATLHCVHNISGLRTGTLPGVTQQNGFLGLPITLMQEETAYLLQQGIAHLVPLNSRLSPPDEDAVKAHTAARVARIEYLEEKAREAESTRQEQSAKAFDKGGEKARLKREARAKARAERARVTAQVSDTVFEDDSQGGRQEIGETSEAKASKQKGQRLHTPGHFHVVPSHPILPTSTSLSTSVITSLPHPLFTFPSTPRDHALVGVFATLQLLGYRIGLGPRFGGEWLVYPGDYLRYHAHFTSQVIVRNKPIKPTEIVAWGRLGTGTKKAGLICCWDDQKQEETITARDDQKKPTVEFYSLEWANFG
ncbi:uncharacterized protein L203_100978 [Cryptococcus depauperatus CBS 7841]|uniref:tRNA-splicing endonuclease subunit Sen34 n=1 Tax=Cryptococcus depauperatus CBS 7841 TaxID=1295531 RepID=A0A1E3IBD7_9TREE|nr:tRNA-splicing endonuclease subunit Sen34 [Cryptococcus depauperatus CBS 7841]